MSASASRSERLHIGVFGRVNAGKSSLVNMISGQSASMVSDVPGTTADPVSKTMEIPGVGPVVLIDTAGDDEESELGAIRKARAREIITRVDIGIIAVDVSRGSDDLSAEGEIADELKRRGARTIVALTKCDIAQNCGAELLKERVSKIAPSAACVRIGLSDGKDDMIKAIAHASASMASERPPLTAGLYDSGANVVLVAPQDAESPKGRLILPQVMTIRDILDNGASALVCTPERLSAILDGLVDPPALVITDSQVFKTVAAIVPDDVPLTSFSILMARSRGDLRELVRGARAIRELTEDSRVLVAEACSHHAIEDDIARVKIPHALRASFGESLTVDVAAGPSALEDLASYQLVIHCGACMLTRGQMAGRLEDARRAGVPMTNFGVALAELSGIMERATEVFRVRTRELEGL